MAYDINRARASGATDDQIIDYLSSTRNYDYKGALNSGASKEQVIDYLSKTNSPHIETPPIKEDLPTQADAISAQEAGATFPSKTGENPLIAGAKSVGNVPSSVFNLGKNLAKAIIHPIETGKGLASFAGGALRTAGEKVGIVEEKDTPGEMTFDAVVSNLKERYGSLEALQRTATNDPVGFGSDFLGVITGGAGIAGKLPAVTKALEKTTEVIKTPVLRTIVGKADDFAIKQMDKALRLNPSDIRKIEKPNIAGENPSSWLLQRKFKGTQAGIADALSEYSTKTKAAKDEGLANITTRIPVAEAQSAQQILDVLKQTFEGVPGNERIVSRIDTLKGMKDYSLTELESIKKLVDGNFKIFSTMGDIKSGAISKGLANLRDDLKTLIEDKATENGFAEVKFLNKETQVAHEIENAIRKRLTTQDKLPELGLRDAVVVAGGFAMGDPTFGFAAVALNKIAESAKFRTHLADKLYNLGKTEKEALLNAADAGNTTLLINFYMSILNEYEKSEQ